MSLTIVSIESSDVALRTGICVTDTEEIIKINEEKNRQAFIWCINENDKKNHMKPSHWGCSRD